MKNLTDHIKLKTRIDSKDLDLLESLFVFQKISPGTVLLAEGKVERYVYFLNKGIVKGYQIFKPKLQKNDILNLLRTILLLNLNL